MVPRLDVPTFIKLQESTLTIHCPTGARFTPKDIKLIKGGAAISRMQPDCNCYYISSNILEDPRAL